MINKIIVSIMFFCLLIALSIAIISPGVTRVELGPPFISFMNSCNMDLMQFKIEIPEIPSIPSLTEVSDGGGFLETLNVIANAIISFANGLVTILNILIVIINVVLELIQFVVIVIKNLITFKDSLAGV